MTVRFLLLFCITLGFSETLTVSVTDIKDDTGVIQLSLFSQEKGFPDDYRKAVKRATLPALRGDLTYQFDSIPPGTYAVAVIHDENKDKTLQKNFFGAPAEGWGVSRNVNPKFRAPYFSEAKFELISNDSITIIVIY